jgi:hypothetical protein
MFKKRIACGLLVLVALCLATVNAPSQQDKVIQKASSAPADTGGVPGPDRLRSKDEPPAGGLPGLGLLPAARQDAQPNLQELVTRLMEVRRKREALDREEARLVSKIREVLAKQQEDLNRVEQLLREHEKSKGRALDKDKGS